jgi:hypothetical protein
LKVHWTLELDHPEMQKEFRTFLNQLCLARDQEEFDRFMAKQRQATATRPLSGQRGA